jgi:hypothetical protein
MECLLRVSPGFGIERNELSFLSSPAIFSPDIVLAAMGLKGFDLFPKNIS